jgi:DNA polymerase-3 subunit alpha
MLRHASTHAAGVVISKNPVDEYVPLYKNQDSISTQFTMTTLEELGLLKMDFLGLRTLTVIHDALYLIEQNREKKGYTEKIDFSSMKYDDKEVYELISSGNTLGVFQLESAGMRNFMKQLKPTTIEDITAGISLYRPGPMDSIPKYIENKNNPQGVTYIHEKLKPILEVTYGCLVYQEQVMQVVRELGGYSYGRSDLVRRAMSKKKMAVMEEERQYFIHGKYDAEGNVEIAGCIRNGVPEEAANAIFDDMIDFAKYAFNKSHAACYAVLAYETAYLKCHYKVEFMAALITSIMGNTNKVVEYINECKLLGIQVLPPDINSSYAKFSVQGNNIRFGLAAVKNVGANVINNIVECRNKEGEFKDFVDFVKRIDQKDTNKRVIESLIKCGAFDSISENRASLMSCCEDVLESVSTDRKKNVKGQVSLFDMLADDDEIEVEEIYHIPFVREYTEKIKLNLEKEVLGMYVTGHPLSEYEEEIKNRTSTNLSVINSKKEDEENYLSLDDQEVIMGGIIAKKNIKTTRKNDLMAFIELEDLFGTIEVLIFPQLYNQYREILQEDEIVLVKGNLSVKEDEDLKLLAREIKLISDKSEFKQTRKYKTYTQDIYNVSNAYEEDAKYYAEFVSQSNLPRKKIYIKIDSLENKEITDNIIEVAKKYSGNDVIYLFPEKQNESYKNDDSIESNQLNNKCELEEGSKSSDNLKIEKKSSSSKKAYKINGVFTNACEELLEEMKIFIPSENLVIK